MTSFHAFAVLCAWGAVVATGLLALLVWVRRPPPQLWPTLFLFYLAGTVFGLGANMSRMVVVSADAYLAWVVVLYTGIMAIPALFWLFVVGCAEWMGHPIGWAKNRVRYAPCVIQATYWLVMITNPWHGQFTELDHLTKVNTQPALWHVYAITAYIIMMASLFVLVWLRWQTRGTKYAGHATLMLAGISFPLAVNVLTTFGVITAVIPHPTAVAISGTGVLFAASIYRRDLFALSKVTLQELTDRDTDAVLVLDHRFFLHYANDAARALFGPDALQPGANVLQAVAPRFRLLDSAETPLTASVFVERLAEPATDPHGHLFRYACDTRTWLRILVVVVRDSSDRALGYSVRVTDVTAQERDRKALADSEVRYRELVNNATDAMFTMNVGGYVLEANPAMQRMLGYSVEELGAFPLLKLAKREDIGRVMAESERVLREGTASNTLEVTMQCKDGQWRTFSLTARPVLEDGREARFEVIARDVTERLLKERAERELQAQRQEGQRLESLGMMAGGVAHDFNNLLVSVLGNAELGLLDAEPGSPHAERLEDIRAAAERAAELSAHMLAYSGKGQIAAEPVDLTHLIQQMRHLLRGVLPQNGTIDYALLSVPTVTADVTQLHQVVMALCVNAAEALGDKDGSVTVSTGMRDLTAADIAALTVAEGVTPGRHAYVEISDTGSGIESELLNRVFDPFYSTKFAGRGLGLAAVHGIVRAHNGAVQVTSVPGEGSSFTILLPAVAAAVSVERPADRPAETWRSSGTVLIVDDEETVREIAEEFVGQLGFDVTTACDGREGVTAFMRDINDIAAVLLDLTMPNMMGDEAYARIRQLQPDVPIVIMSGYTATELPESFQQDERARFLAKPFRHQELTETLRALIDAPAYANVASDI